MASRACIVIGFGLGLLGAGWAPAAAAKMVPAGNRHAEQPAVPGVSAKRTNAARTTYEAKYGKVYQLLKNDRGLISKIRKVARLYQVDPIHIVGAIVGEHTYNVDAYDRLQTYYVKAISYLKSDFSFDYDGETVGAFVQRPEFSECDGESGSYDVWTCREAVWDKAFRGRTVDGRRWPDDRFGAVFFQPFYAGQTFGIGQLNPLTALKMTDTVNTVSGLRRLDHDNPQEVYRTIMDPDMSLAYVAATVKSSISAYRRIADLDISENPGVIATLYNLGNPEARAARLAAENRLRRTRGKTPKWPEENYYGWLVNEKLEELKALFPES